MRAPIILYLGSLCCLFTLISADDIEDVVKVDTEPLLKDKAKWKALFDCLMDRAPCGEFQFLRDKLPELITTSCQKCSPTQKELFDSKVKMFAEKYPKDFAEVSAKFLNKQE